MYIMVLLCNLPTGIKIEAKAVIILGIMINILKTAILSRSIKIYLPDNDMLIIGWKTLSNKSNSVCVKLSCIEKDNNKGI